MIRREVVFSIVVTCLTSFAQAQKPASGPPINSVPTLQVVETIVSNENALATHSPYQCDGDGNIYLRPHDIGFRAGWGQILKFNAKGEKTTTFNMPVGFLTTSFFVDQDGAVYVMAADETPPTEKSNKRALDVYILRFKDDGSLDAKIRLDASVIASGSFVVFPTGQILASVIEAAAPGEKGPPDKGLPFTAVFDQGGQLLRRISAKDDDWIAEAVKNNDKTKVSGGRGTSPPVALGQALVGSDGNAYVMRRSLPAVVYVISSGGSLVRTLKLSSGTPPLMPSIMLENQGQLAIVFQNTGGPGEERVKVFNARTGEELQTATVEPPLGSAVVCYNAPRFTFLMTQDGKYSFLMAQIR